MALKKKQLEEFRQRLLQMRAEMTQHLKGAKADVQTPEEAKGYSQHQADEGTEDFDRRISIELTSMEADTVRQVDRALEKLDEGTYGVCDITGDPIPLKRLEAIPYATMTCEAQEKLERGLLQ